MGTANHLEKLGEFGLIDYWRKNLGQRAGVRLGIGDDAAVLDSLQVPIVTCDGLIEKVHFRRDWTSPRALGHKAIAVNVSDIAAMGGRPVAAFITIAISPHDDLKFLEELYAGFEEAAAHYNLSIAGGDTVRSPAELMLNVTVIGNAPMPILRSGAQVGDVLLVTGILGDSAAGLALLQNPSVTVPDTTRQYLLQRHHDPTARLAEMQATLQMTPATERLAAVAPDVTAALDISDGLAGDAAHIAERSSLSLEIEVAQLPISQFCQDAAEIMGASALDLALRGGEDYELLLCVPPNLAADVQERITRTTGTQVTAVGRCIARIDDAVILIYPDGRREAAGMAFSHF